MPKFKHRPVVIEAVKFQGETNIHPALFLYKVEVNGREREFPAVKTRRGPVAIDVGDWVVTGIKGCHYPVKADIFEELYERVE